MLPITNHRSFHIPHSLATLAAIVALVTALGWDASDSGPTVAESAGDALDPMASVNAQEVDAPGKPAAPGRSGGRDSETDVLSGLLPLVLPSVSGF